MLVSLADSAVLLPLVTVPPQRPVRFGGFATTRPAGRLSVNPTPVNATVLAAGFVIVNDNEVVPFSGTLTAPNDLEIDGGAITVRTAVLLVAPVPLSVEVIAPVVLLLLPPVVAVTSTEKVHADPTAGDAVSVPPDRLTLPLPAVPVIVPLPQEPVILGVAATTTPAGKLSVKPTP